MFGGAVGGEWGRGGARERLSFGFCRRKNQPPSFPRCRFEAGHGRTRVQSGPAAKRHHRKIRRLFLRGSPAKSKRKPLHHVLRTAGTLPTVSGRAFLTARVEQRPMERGQNAEVGGQGEPNSRLERAESRGQRSGGTGQPEQPNSLLTQRARTKRKRRKRFFGGGGRKTSEDNRQAFYLFS